MYTCTCGHNSCGNGAVGGNPGQVPSNLSENDVKQNYRPCDNINGESTGWTCIDEQTHKNFCSE